MIRILTATCVLLIGGPLHAEATTAREARTTKGARESCRQDITGLYLNAINDLDYASGTLAAAQRSLAANRKAVAKAQKTLKTLQESYQKKPEDFQRKHAADSAFFRVSQLDGQAVTLRGVIAEQKAVMAKARGAKQHISRSLARVFRVKHKKNAPYNISIRYREPCGRFKYICPPTAGEVAAIRTVFKGRPMTTACQKFLGHLEPAKR